MLAAWECFVGQDHLLNHSFVHLEALRFSSPSETLEFGPLNVIVCFAKLCGRGT